MQFDRAVTAAGPTASQLVVDGNSYPPIDGSVFQQAPDTVRIEYNNHVGSKYKWDCPLGDPLISVPFLAGVFDIPFP